MQVGSLRTGLLYEQEDVPKAQRCWHRVGIVEVLRGANGDKLGLVTSSLDGWYDFESDDSADRIC